MIGRRAARLTPTTQPMNTDRTLPLLGRTGLRWFALGGVAATAVDAGLYVLLRTSGSGLVLSDLVALITSAAVSYALHRLIWMRRDPFVRWMHYPGLFVVVAMLAGLVDMAMLSVLGDRHLLSKIIAIAAAAVVRAMAYRFLLLRVVRNEQSSPANRATPPGGYRLTVVVPAYREADRIAGTIRTIHEQLDHLDPNGVEIVVVDDGSGDATADIAEASGAVVVKLIKNQGKGGAVRAGVLSATGRTIAFLDADLAYQPRLLENFVVEIENGWDVVVGNRKHVATTTLAQAGRLREIGGRLVNLATHALLLGHYRDTQCGLKAFRSDVARMVFGLGRVDGFAFDVEIFHLVERYRLSLHEVPVTVENSERSTVRLVADTRRLVADLFRVRRWAARGVYDLDPSTIDLPGPGTRFGQPSSSSTILPQ